MNTETVLHDHTVKAPRLALIWLFILSTTSPCMHLASYMWIMHTYNNKAFYQAFWLVMTSTAYTLFPVVYMELITKAKSKQV